MKRSEDPEHLTKVCCLTRPNFHDDSTHWRVDRVDVARGELGNVSSFVIDDVHDEVVALLEKVEARIFSSETNFKI